MFGTSLKSPEKIGRAQSLSAQDVGSKINITSEPHPTVETVSGKDEIARAASEPHVSEAEQSTSSMMALAYSLGEVDEKSDRSILTIANRCATLYLLGMKSEGCSHDGDGLVGASLLDTQSQDKPRLAPKDNRELARLFEEEQADHASRGAKTTKSTITAARHLMRVARVRQLQAQNKLQTGADYYRAAVILLRGGGPDDYRRGAALGAIALKFGWPHFPHIQPEQDCNAGIPVCQNTYSQTQSYMGVGFAQEVAAGTCLGSKESNSVWYVFTAQTNGSLTFTINTLKDYDFALYNITNGGCAGVPGSMPIRCNFSVSPGTTGLTAPAAPQLPALSENAGGSPLMPGVNVIAGQTYALLVNNFTGDQNGYTLMFGGTASIFDVTPPKFQSATLDPATCEIEVTMSEPIRCSTIAADGSDFQLLTTGANVVTGARGIDCGNFTNKIRLTYSRANVDICGFWGILSRTGTDGNTLIDNCANSLAVGETLTLQTPPTATANILLPGNVNTFCKDASIIVNGSSNFATRHFWSVVESDANGIALGPEYSNWFAGPAGNFDVGQFATQKGLTLECNKFYRIKLAVSSCCTPWNETTKVVKITCQGATAAFTLPKTEYCAGETIIADGSPSQNETNNFWSIQESDQNWNRYGPERMGWFTGPAGIKNLTQFGGVKNFTFKCNTYYRVKLAVAGCGSSWNETTQLIHVSCPDAGPDRRVCCGSQYPVQIGSAGIPGVTYSWTSSPAGFTSSLANPMVHPSGTTTYTLTSTGSGGCTTTDSVTLTCLTYPELRIDLSTGGTSSVKDPYGTPDWDWRIRAVPGMIYGTPAPPSYSVKPLVWIASWAPNGFANWISPEVNPDGTPPMLAATAWPPDPTKIDYFYEYKFYLDLTQFQNPKIEINEVAVDNNAEIYLNSQVLWGNPNNFTDVGLNQWFDSHFTTMHGPFQITNGFVNGWNTLLIRVRNGGGPWGPTSWTGLLVRGGIRASCK